MSSGPAPRLTLLVPRLVVGGAERALVFLANELARVGEAVDLVVIEAGGPLRAQVAPAVRVVELGSGGMLAGLPRLVGYLRRERPRAVLSTLTYANVVTVWAARLARTGVPVYVREATTLSRNPLPGWKGKAVYRLAPSAYAAAARVIAVSQGVADDLIENFRVPREHVRVIYNPSLPDGWQQLSRADVAHPWLADSGNGAGPAVILAVGRMTDAKDYPTLVHAFERVRQRRPARLVILGDGELRAPLERLVTERGLADHVSLPGFVDNPFAYMARAAVFVLSSRYEGMPNVLIQAMACGCPVVSTDCRSGPREVLEDGRYGALVPIEDPAALADAIDATLDGRRPPGDPRERARRFTADRIGAEYLDAMR